MTGSLLFQCSELRWGTSEQPQETQKKVFSKEESSKTADAKQQSLGIYRGVFSEGGEPGWHRQNSNCLQHRNLNLESWNHPVIIKDEIQNLLQILRK